MVLVMFGAGKLDLDAMAGRQMAGSSVIGWTVSCVMSRARWLMGLYAMTPQGIELHPELLRAAAAMPLDAAARFDETGLRRLLSRPIPSGASP